MKGCVVLYKVVFVNDLLLYIFFIYDFIFVLFWFCDVLLVKDGFVFVDCVDCFLVFGELGSDYVLFMF